MKNNFPVHNVIFPKNIIKLGMFFHRMVEKFDQNSLCAIILF